MKKSNQPPMGKGALVLLCLFAVAIVAMCVFVLLWNAGQPEKPASSASSSAVSSSGKSTSSAASSKPAVSSKPVASSASQKPAASATSQSAASSGEAVETPVVNRGQNGNYLLNTEADIRAAAYDQLGEDDKSAVGDNWKTASVDVVNLRGGAAEIKDMNYVGQNVYLVDITRVDKPNTQPNNILVYLAMDTGKLIGFGFVD